MKNNQKAAAESAYRHSRTAGGRNHENRPHRPYHHWDLHTAHDVRALVAKISYPFYLSYYEDTPTNYDDLFSVAKAFGVTADEVQALLDYGCSEEEIEEMLYDPELFYEMTGELLYAY